MKIYSMTATFGKLNNQTLTLQPGLNVISAPNEWGKSTWCAFLVNMLYGLETRVKTTKTSIADKDRYAPWSGSPMSGRIDLHWNGRDITIERWTKGRTPMGEFRAYETQSGITVPELTATTCGEMLLGVERSVLAFLCDAYDEQVVGQDKNGNDDVRVVMHFHPALAPFKAAVLPLSKKLSPKAEEIYHMLQKDFMVDFDDAGSIGKRYRREDEIGTPYCITVDFETVGDENTPGDNCVTVRDRDTMEQVRVPIDQLKSWLAEKIAY